MWASLLKYLVWRCLLIDSITENVTACRESRDTLGQNLD